MRGQERRERETKSRRRGKSKREEEGGEGGRILFNFSFLFSPGLAQSIMLPKLRQGLPTASDTENN